MVEGSSDFRLPESSGTKPLHSQSVIDSTQNGTSSQNLNPLDPRRSEQLNNREHWEVLQGVGDKT